MQVGWLRAALLAIAVAGAVGCSRTGQPGSVVQGEAGCRRYCERNYAVCEDAEPARRGSNPLFGADAACTRQHDQCMKRCSTLATEPEEGSRPKPPETQAPPAVP